MAQLPDGAPVLVMWSGGNGPHRYLKKDGPMGPVACVRWEIERGIFDYDGKSLARFVGQERFHTRVWLAE